MRRAASTRAANARRGGEFERGEGHASSWASREANAPRTRILVAELLDSQRERLNELFDQTLNVIKDVFQARKIFVVSGLVVDGGPDHCARIEAAKLFMGRIFAIQGLLITCWRAGSPRDVNGGVRRR